MIDKTAEYWRKIGDEKIRRFNEWRYKAQLLHRASQVCLKAKQEAFEYKQAYPGEYDRRTCHHDIALEGPAQLLLGLAIENYLKAFHVKTDNTCVDERWFYTHDLINLAAYKNSFKLSEQLRHALEQLTHIVNWSGRYPTPKWNSDKNRTEWDLYSRSEYTTSLLSPNIKEDEVIEYFFSADQIPGVLSREDEQALETFIDEIEREIEKLPDNTVYTSLDWLS